MRSPDAAVLNLRAAPVITARTGAPTVLAPSSRLQEPGIPTRAEQSRELARTLGEGIPAQHLLGQNDGRGEVIAARDGVVGEGGNRWPIGGRGLVRIEARGQIRPTAS